MHAYTHTHTHTHTHTECLCLLIQGSYFDFSNMLGVTFSDAFYAQTLQINHFLGFNFSYSSFLRGGGKNCWMTSHSGNEDDVFTWWK